MNDMQAVIELIKEIGNHFTERFDTVERQLASLDQRIDALDQRSQSLEQRVGSLEEKVEELREDMKEFREFVGSKLVEHDQSIFTIRRKLRSVEG